MDVNHTRCSDITHSNLLPYNPGVNELMGPSLLSLPDISVINIKRNAYADRMCVGICICYGMQSRQYYKMVGPHSQYMLLLDHMYAHNCDVIMNLYQ